MHRACVPAADLRHQPSRRLRVPFWPLGDVGTKMASGDFDTSPVWDVVWYTVKPLSSYEGRIIVNIGTAATA